MKKILFQTLAAAACLVACNRNVTVETIETGSLYLALSEETEFITVETKAGTDYTDFNRRTYKGD